MTKKTNKNIKKGKNNINTSQFVQSRKFVCCAFSENNKNTVNSIITKLNILGDSR